MKVLTIITSFNRQSNLLNMLNKLVLQKTDFLIYDDASNFHLNIPEFKRFKENHGKEYCWLKFKKIFKDIPKNYDYYIILPDDIDFNDNFVNNAVKMWQNLECRKKICLSILTDNRVKSPNWTNFEPVIEGDYIKTQWMDLCLICKKEFFNVEILPISLERWQILAKSMNIELGSGLGGQISRYWNDKGKTMYHVKDSLVTHGNLDSIMNKIERLINPLNT